MLIAKKEKLLFRRPVSKAFFEIQFVWDLWLNAIAIFNICIFLFLHMLQEQFQLNVTDMKGHEH